MHSMPHNSSESGSHRPDPRTPALRIPERRRDKRTPAAFGFWFRRDGASEPHSAWMLDTSAGGAAFLTAADAAPAIGELLQLSEMHCNDQLVREHAAGLPRAGRVLRVEPDQSATRRVAIRFESADECSLAPRGAKFEPRTLPQSRIPPVPPAFVAAGWVLTSRSA